MDLKYGGIIAEYEEIEYDRIRASIALCYLRGELKIQEKEYSFIEMVLFLVVFVTLGLFWDCLVNPDWPFLIVLYLLGILLITFLFMFSDTKWISKEKALKLLFFTCLAFVVWSITDYLPAGKIVSEVSGYQGVLFLP